MEENPLSPPLVLEEVLEPAEEDTNGSMAKFEGPSRHARRWRAALPPCFLCSVDELGFDMPARALDADEPL
jgi:hypothetical protein